MVRKREVIDNIYIMSALTIKFKKLDPTAVIPTRGSAHAVGLDLSIVGFKPSDTDSNVVYFRTGLAAEPPVGYYFEIHARSSLHKWGWTLANSVGIIDSDYRGELLVAVAPVSNGAPKKPEPGTRIAQLVLRRDETCNGVEIVEAELTKTQRGEGGFGSTGTT